MAETPMKYYSNIQENKIANSLNWVTVPASGARFGHPGDVAGRDWLCECKTHSSPGHKICFNAAVWNKLKQEAMVEHKFPALFVDDGSQRLDRTWVIFPYLLCMRSNMVLKPIPIKFRTNLLFEHADMQAKYKSAFDRYADKFGIFTVNFGDAEYGLTTFSAFRLNYGDLS